MIDSHCHLADATFDADRAAVIDRAQEAGVSSVLCVLDAGSDEEMARAGRLAERWPDVRFAVGIHPHQAGAWSGRIAEAVAQVSARLDGETQARAVGEIGLDFHYDFAPREVQVELFRAQVRLARARDLPIVIHAREAEPLVLDILAQEGGGRGVFHCFTGDAASAAAALAAGFHLGFGGILTFPRGGNVRDVARATPLDRALVETDSPFLAPVPHRGKRNEPAWVVRAAEALAEIHGVDLSTVNEATTRAFEGLFRP